MNSRIFVLSTLLALPLGNALADGEAVVETKAVPAPAGAPAQRLVRPARFELLERLLEAGRAEIAALNEQLRAAATVEQRDAIQLQIVAAKRAQRERFLEERLALAEEDGDELQAAEARRQLEHLRNQDQQSKTRVERPTPSEEGGR